MRMEPSLQFFRVAIDPFQDNTKPDKKATQLN